MRTWRIGAACLLALSACPAAAQPQPAAPPFADQAWRDAWTPRASRYLRDWTIAASDARATEAPSGGSVWTSWGDTVFVAGNLPGTGRYLRATATVTRAEAGDVEISVGAGQAWRLWVNGVELRGEGAQPFAYDRVRVPVRLRAGENRIALELDRGSGNTPFAVRVLQPGTAIADRPLLSPVLGEANGQLSILTDAAARHEGRRVHVTALGAGGRVAAETEVNWGATARLDPAGWADGAYEIRLASTDQWGAPVYAHLPWYKGDGAAAAHALAAAARAAPNDAAGGQLRMLADLIRYRTGTPAEEVIAAEVAAIHPALLEYEEIRANNAVRPFGFVRLGWTDEVDGSTQFCRAYLPANYDPRRRWPLVVYLHGYNGDNPPYVGFWNVDRRHYDLTERYETILVEVHGRGNIDYRHMGEADVMRCIREAQGRFAVDSDRIYLNGESMGGGGTWFVGSRNAATFAAISPVFGGWDYRLRFDRGQGNPAANSAVERFVGEMQSTFAGAENLSATPIYIVHGDADAAVPIEYSRFISRMLQRWGYDLRYEEMPGWRHEDLNSRWRITEWLLAHRRAEPPRQVRLRSAELRGARAHWLEVVEFEQPLNVIRAEAEVLEPGVVRLDTENVAGVRLRLPSGFWGRGDIQVIWNGEARSVPQLTGDGSVTLYRAARGPGLRKSPDLQGGMGDILRTPYAIVVGTASRDPAMNRALAERGAALAGLWRQWQHVYPRLVTDREVTPEMEANLSLILLGGPAENAVSARLGNRVPLRVRGSEVTIDGRRFDAPDAAAQTVYPSPFSPQQRYVLLVAPTSTAGMRFWDPTSFWSWIAGCPCQPLDWAITDGRLVLPGEGLGRERGWIASGTYDAAWRRDDRWTFLGDAPMRSAALLRSPSPAPELAALEPYVGRYPFVNRVATVTLENGRLRLNAPSLTGGPVELVPEGNEVFTAPGVASPLLFLRNAQGRVTGLGFYRYDSPFWAMRAPD